VREEEERGREIIQEEILDETPSIVRVIFSLLLPTPPPLRESFDGQPRTIILAGDDAELDL
jgi:hypothetical protein